MDRSRTAVGRGQGRKKWEEFCGGGAPQDMFINPHSVPGAVPGTRKNTKTNFPLKSTFTSQDQSK